MKEKKRLFGLVGKKSRGYTLLEYCAGAALIAGILWGALSLLGNNLSDLLGAVGSWAQQRTTEVKSSSGGE